MRFVSLLLALAVLGYVIKVYLDSSADRNTGEYTSRPKQTIEHAQDTADRLNQAIQLQQKKVEESGQE